MAWGRRLDRSDPCSCLSWASPKHDLRGMCVFVCVCVYCAGGLYIIYDLGGCLLHVVCVYCAGGLYVTYDLGAVACCTWYMCDCVCVREPERQSGNRAEPA